MSFVFLLLMSSETSIDGRLQPGPLQRDTMIDGLHSVESILDDHLGKQDGLGVKELSGFNIPQHQLGCKW